MRLARVTLVWALLAAAIGVPLALAATSELLEWRGPVYIVAGFAGIIALALLLARRAKRRTALPLGPALLTGALLGVLLS